MPRFRRVADPVVFLRATFAALALSAAALLAIAPALAGPPATRVEVVRESLHGTEIEDPYRWLEDQEDPATRAWIAEQVAYTESVLGQVPGRDRVRKHLERLLKVDNVSMPYEENGRFFFSKRRADQNLSVLIMRKGLDGADEVLVDPHPLSPDHTTSVVFLDVSRDGSLMAYGTRTGGEDEMTVSLLDVDTRKQLPDRLPRARYFGISIRPDKRGFYYTRHDSAGSRVRYHAFGTDAANDPLVFGQGYGPEKIIYSNLSDNGRYLLITVLHGSAAKKAELYLKDVVVGGAPVTVVNDLDAYFEGIMAGDRLYLRTNWQAPRWRVLAAPLAKPGRSEWKEVVPQAEAVMEDLSVAGGRLFANYLKDVVSSVTVFDPEGRAVRTLEMPTLGSFSSIRGRWGSDLAFFTFESFHVPRTIYRYQVSAGGRETWWRAEVPFDSDPYALEQVWYTSKDGTKIPMFVLARKDVKLDGTNPVLLTSYGGFNVTLTPGFSTLAAAWVQSGGVFAQPNLRGGGEFGEAWHEAGMLGNKQNVFDDFHAAAEWLIEKRYTNPQKLAIVGGSNGGLLVGAALTQRPELFRAVVCAVPLLDMVRYHKFLVARFWVPEYGSADDPEQFKWLYAYSPYHRVQKGVKYPAVLFMTGDSDTRVAPLHARKMAALLQAATGSQHPVLLHYDTKLGHAGGKPVHKQIEDLTAELLFLTSQLGMAGQAEAVGAGAKAKGAGK